MYFIYLISKKYYFFNLKYNTKLTIFRFQQINLLFNEKNIYVEI